MEEKAVLFALVVGSVLLLLYFLWGKKHSKLKIPPGWKDPQKSSDERDSGVYRNLMKEHEDGRCPVKGFWWNGVHVVSVCSPKSYKDTENLYNRPANFFGKDGLHGMRAIQNINDSVWLERKSRLHKCVRGGNLKSYYPVFVTLSRDVVKSWISMEQIDIVKEMHKFFMKAIVTTLYGDMFEDDKGFDELVRLYDNCKILQDSKYGDDDTLTSHEHLSFQQDLKKLQDHMKKILQFRKTSKSGHSFPLTDELLKADYDEEEMVSHMLSFLGGYHTITFYISWLFFYLSNNIEIQEKLAAEIENNIDNDSKLNAYIQTSSSYLRQVLDEALRLSGTAAFSAHYSNKDIMVEGYHVPAKTPIIQALGVTFRSSKVWDDPLQFNPDRFAPQSPHTKRGREFRPFGVSCIRRCPASQLVYHLVSTFISILLHRHTVLPTGSSEKINGKIRLTTAPSEAVFIKIIPR